MSLQGIKNNLWLARELANKRHILGANPGAGRWGKEMLRPVVQGIAKSGPVRFAGGLLGKAFSWPATIVTSELFQHNPWGDKNSAMYGKGPGSLEYQAALESADAAGGFVPTEDDYLKTPPVLGSAFTPVSTNVVEKSDEFLNWLAKTANSPAQQSGAWSTPEGKDQLWQQHLMNQDFQQAKKSGTLDDFAAKYPHSQTAKERAIRNKIPSSLEMEF